MKYLFADEAGCLVFKRSPQVSKFFVLCTVLTEDCSVAADMLSLRRELAWEGVHLEADKFHATSDPHAVRDRVIDLLSGQRVRVDATIFEKSKVIPARRASEEEFYRFAWFFHLRYVAGYALPSGEDVLIHAASIGTRKKRVQFRAMVNDAAQQTLRGRFRATFWESSSDPCLQVADYYAWAIQRRLERGDDRAHAALRHNIRSEYDIFRTSDQHFF